MGRFSHKFFQAQSHSRSLHISGEMDRCALLKVCTRHCRKNVSAEVRVMPSVDEEVDARVHCRHDANRKCSASQQPADACRPVRHVWCSAVM